MTQPAPGPDGPAAYILDHTALLAAGTGSRLVSGLIAAAHRNAGLYLYAPALCVAAATAGRPALGEHLGLFDALRIIELDYPAALRTGELIAAGVDWRGAQAIAAARPTAEWPTGRPAVTADPAAYIPWGVQTVDL